MAKKIIGETPFLEFRIPKNNEFVPSGLTGEYLQKAEALVNPNTLEPIVSLEFNQEGAKIFKDLTQKYLGQPIAIYLDGKLISSPVVREVIENGKAQITGKFTLDEARLLANRLNQGALPAPLNLIAESVVNPILSENILKIALYASILGVILVILFMIIFYGFYGFLADIALIFFLVFNLALYKILGVTISLASLSGLVLAVGMAVDANILIFERMKEEKQRGLKIKEVIKEGFDRAFPSIRDSNMTTIISSLLIYFLAVSFVKGFALTLLFGVIFSFLTAVFFTRYLLEIVIKE
jgi:preprotein translocase subunit SecD